MKSTMMKSPVRALGLHDEFVNSRAAAAAARRDSHAAFLSQTMEMGAFCAALLVKVAAEWRKEL